MPVLRNFQQGLEAGVAAPGGQIGVVFDPRRPPVPMVDGFLQASEGFSGFAQDGVGAGYLGLAGVPASTAKITGSAGGWSGQRSPHSVLGKGSLERTGEGGMADQDPQPADQS